MYKREDKMLAKEQKRLQRLLPILAGMVFVLAFPFLATAVGNTYAITLGCYVQLYFIAISGYDILFGYCGQINMGLAGFYAIGAYGSAILHAYCNVPIVFSMIIASVISCIIGAILAFPCSKLQFHFLTLATIAFGNIVNQILSHSPGGITGNFKGMYTERPMIFGFSLSSSTAYYFFGLVMVAVFIFIKYRVVHSKMGRAFCAIRDNVRAANGMGIDVRLYKVIAFSVCAFFMGFAGSMYAHLVCFISPDTFLQKQSVLFLTMLIFGGTTSFGGPLVGVLSLMLITESIRSMTGYQTLVYGVIIILVVVLLPKGVYGELRGLIEKLIQKRNSSDIRETI